MPVSLRLAIRQWLARPLRPILCSLAIAAAVALIVGVGAGFDSLRATFLTTATQMLGRGDAHVRSSTRGVQNRLPAEMLGKIRARPEVAVASGRMEAQVSLQRGGGDRVWFHAVGVEPAADAQLRPKTYVAGGPPMAADELAIDETVAKQTSAGVGDAVTVSGDGGRTREAKVVGVVRKPQLEMIAKPTVIVPLESLVRDVGMAGPEYNVIDIKLAGKVDGSAQESYAKKLGEELGKAVTVTPAENRKNVLAKSAEQIDPILMILSLISGICAALIISTTLSVGVQERLRQFGQLRCIGASRAQMIQILAADALLLMVGGTLMGLAIGMVGSRWLIGLFPNLFLEYRLEAKSLVFAIGNGALATLLGSAIPAWQVARITPMEAVRVAAKQARSTGVWRAGIVGLSLLTGQVALFFATSALGLRDLCFWSYAILGIPAIFAGYCLLGPATLLLSQRVAAAGLGGALRVRPALLQQAWSRTPWRAGAMIAALMIGMVLFTAVKQRSEGLMRAWDFPARFPDLLLFNPYGMPTANGPGLRDKLPSVTAFTELAVVPVKLKKQLFGSGRVLPNNTTRFAAIDPVTFPEMVEMEFVQGDQASAFERLKKGRALLVSQEFYNARGVGKGAMLPFATADGQTVEFEVAGVVRSSGIEMSQAYFDQRGAFADEAISSVVGTLEDARKYFGARGVNMVLLSVQRDGRPSEQVIEEVRSKIKGFGWQAASVIEMKEKIGSMIRRIVSAMSAIAVAAMAVASLGVANMVIASVQARQYEFGVLRAIGTGRGQLVRMVLAEVTLVSLVAGVLGTAAGLHYTWMATMVDRLLVGFATPFGWTWRAPVNVAMGLGITIALGWLAAVLPAVRTAFRAQRALLAAGRA